LRQDAGCQSEPDPAGHQDHPGVAEIFLEGRRLDAGDHRDVADRQDAEGHRDEAIRPELPRDACPAARLGDCPDSLGPAASAGAKSEIVGRSVADPKVAERQELSFRQEPRELPLRDVARQEGRAAVLAANEARHSAERPESKDAAEHRVLDQQAAELCPALHQPEARRTGPQERRLAHPQDAAAEQCPAERRQKHSERLPEEQRQSERPVEQQASAPQRAVRPKRTRELEQLRAQQDAAARQQLEPAARRAVREQRALSSRRSWPLQRRLPHPLDL